MNDRIPSAVRSWTTGGIAAGLLVLAGVLLGFQLFGGAPSRPERSPQSSTIGGPFELVDTNGGTVTDRTFRGKWLLVYFGYTYCPDVCPTTLGNISLALDKLGPLADAVQPLFVTVDPRRDTPQVLRDYLTSFDPRIVGLSGSPDRIAAAAKAYKVLYSVRQSGKGPDDYLMDHTTLLYLMGTDGRLVTFFGNESSADDIADKLRRILAQPS
jgi:protein SCO1